MITTNSGEEDHLARSLLLAVGLFLGRVILLDVGRHIARRRLLIELREGIKKLSQSKRLV